MKRIIALLRSMKFGVALLMLVMFISFIGSLIPQGRVESWYIENYPKFGTLVTALDMDHLFSSWYFIVIIGLLCANLMFCTIIRLNSVRKIRRNCLNEDVVSSHSYDISGDTADKIRSYLASKGYKQRDNQTGSVFYKNLDGYYGSFTVHLSILLTLVFGGLVLGLSTVNDYNVMPGESYILQDGTELHADSFRITDENGRTDYASIIRVTAPNGEESEPYEIKVNFPFTFKTHKYYQHTYGITGAVTARNTETGGSDLFYLSEPSFLSGDGKNGFWFEALYPGFVEDDDGHIIPISGSASDYPNPIYQVLVSNDGIMEATFVRPGEIIEAGNIEFEFNSPTPYPGIRVKDIPVPFPALLYASFFLMVFGFWLCFFYTPAIVRIKADNCALSGLKTVGLQLEIEGIIFNNAKS